MGVYIKNWSIADWKELFKWAKIGANNVMIGEFTEVEEVPPHGRLIDADAIPFNEPIRSMMVFGGEIVIAKTVIDEAPTVIPADKEGAE